MLIEGLGQGALQKELLVAPFVEHFKTAALGESYREILSVLETINSKIVFLPNFCWQKAKYKMLYERNCSLLLS